MAPAIPIITALAGAAMSYQSYRQQKKAAKTSEQLGRMNQAAVEAETREEAFRLQENQKRALAESVAMGAATGFVGGTQDIWQSDIQKTQSRELGWLKKSGASRAAIEGMKGVEAGQYGRAQAMGSLADTVGQLGQAAQAGADWYSA